MSTCKGGIPARAEFYQMPPPILSTNLMTKSRVAKRQNETGRDIERHTVT